MQSPVEKSNDPLVNNQLVAEYEPLYRKVNDSSPQFYNKGYINSNPPPYTNVMDRLKNIGNQFGPKKQVNPGTELPTNSGGNLKRLRTKKRKTKKTRKTRKTKKTRSLRIHRRMH